MKRTILLFFACLFSISVFGQSEIKRYLYLEDKNGDVEEFLFTNATMTIVGNLIQIDTPEESFEYDYDTIERFYFKFFIPCQEYYSEPNYWDELNVTGTPQTATVLAEPPEGGTVTGGDIDIPCGTAITVAAISDDCYTFVNWTNNGTEVSTNLSHTFTLTGDSTLVANFQIKTYDINVSANPTTDGTVTVLGDGTGINCGTSKTVIATPNPCYNFISWTEGGNIVSPEASYTFLVTVNRDLVANFEIKICNINVSASPTAGGTVTVLGSNTGIVCGTSKTVVATPDPCYNFIGWTEGGNLVSSEASYTFPIMENRNLVAKFQIKTYNVNVSANPMEGGVVTVLGGGTSINCGTSKTVVAMPNPCYNFIGWTEGGNPVFSETSYTFPVTGSRDLVANFERIYPNNDACNQAIEIFCETPPVLGDLACAIPTTSIQYSHSQNNNDVFYHFTAANTGNYTITLNFFGGDKRLYLYADCSATMPLKSATSGASPRIITYNNCIAETTYYIRVTNNSSGGGGEFDVSLAYTPWQIGKTPDDNITATFNSNNSTLTIAGSSEMQNFDNGTLLPPWHCVKDDIINVIIDNNVTRIGDYAFFECTSLEWIEMDGVITIGQHSFEKCTSLNSLSIPNSVTNILTSAFDKCSSLNSVTMPNSVISIGSYAFRDCTTLQSVTMPNSITVIGTGTFQNCISLPSITIPASVATINGSAFRSCSSLGTVTIPNSVITIGGQAFYNCSNLTSLTIGESVKSIGEYAFYNCTSLTSVAIPHSVTTIGMQAFYNCSSLTSLTINDNDDYMITNIGQKAFMNCTSLNDVTIHWSIPFPLNYSMGVFDGHPALNNVDLHVPQGTECTYKAAPVWSNFNVVGAEVSITILKNPPEGGTVIGNGIKPCGTVTVTATPNDCYIFKNWTENGTQVSTNPSYTFNATDDRTLVANFEKKLHDVIISANPPKGGTVTGGNTNIPCGENVTVKAMPNECYNFVNWTEGDTEVSTNPIYTFTATANRTLKANFTQKTYDITATANPPEGGTVTVTENGGSNILCGTLVTIVALANTNYDFVNWTKDGAEVSTNVIYNFTITEDINLVANFVEKVGIAETGVSGIRVYPNPTKDEFYIKSDLQIEKVEVYTATGALLLSDSNFRDKISLAAFTTGVYIVKVYTDEGVAVRKVVKE